MKFSVLATVALSLFAECLAQTSQNPMIFNKFIDYEASHMFPKDAFNADCITASCPELSTSDLCPDDTDGGFNCAAINKTMSILNTCLATRKPICNTTIEPIVFAPATYVFSLNLILLNVYMTCTINPNAVFVTKLSESVYGLTKDQCVSDGCLLLTVTNPSVYYYGSASCEVGLNSTLIPIFKSGLKLGSFINTPFSSNLPFAITSRLNCSNDQTPAPIVQIKTKNPTFYNISLPFWAPIYDIQEYYMDNSQFGRSLAAFFNSMATSAIQATKQSCSKAI